MKKLIDTEKGSLFVGKGSNVYYLKYDEQSSAQLAEQPFEGDKSEQSKAQFEITKEREKEEKDNEKQEILRKNAERQGIFVQ